MKNAVLRMLPLFALAILAFILWPRPDNEPGKPPPRKQETPSPAPAPEPGTAEQPPDFARPKIALLGVTGVATWTAKTDPESGAISVDATDGDGKRLIRLLYDKGKNYTGHYTFRYFYDQYDPRLVTGVQIDKFEDTGPSSPGIFHHRVTGQTLYEYDRSSRLKGAWLKDSFNNLVKAIQLEYDPDGKLERISRTGATGESAATESPTNLDKLDLKTDLLSFYFSPEFAVDKIGNGETPSPAISPSKPSFFGSPLDPGPLIQPESGYSRVLPNVRPGVPLTTQPGTEIDSVLQKQEEENRRIRQQNRQRQQRNIGRATRRYEEWQQALKQWNLDHADATPSQQSEFMRNWYRQWDLEHPEGQDTVPQ